MTKLARIVLVPGDATVTDVSDAGAVDIPIRQAKRFDDLAAALSARLEVPARVCDDWSGLTPGTGVLVVCRPDGLWRLEEADADADALSWVAAVDVSRSEALKQAERLGLAASVESLDYGDWVAGRPQGPAAIYGQVRVADAIGAVVADDPLDRGHRYARLVADGVDDLPALLGRYLAEYL